MISSMTAFGHSKIEGAWGCLSWEVRSVNHRYLDVNLRLPELFNPVEMKFRECIRDTLSRGKIDGFLRFYPGKKTPCEVQLNRSLIHALQQASIEISEHLGEVKPLTAMEVMSWPGSISLQTQADADLLNWAEQALADALDKLKQARLTEGEKLSEFIELRNEKVGGLVCEAKQLTKEAVSFERGRMLERLKQCSLELDENRLEQEVVLAVQRLDVTEELDRLQAHVMEFGRLLRQECVVGRRLDFLLQEFNREANTLASKSGQTELTNIAVELKVLIEQMREQVQNIE